MKNPRNQYGFKMPCSRTHAANRKYVCTACGFKIKENQLQGTVLGLYKLYVWPEYDEKVLSSPCGICNTCKKNLYELQKGEVISETTLHAWILNAHRIKKLPKLLRGEYIILLVYILFIN